jgi:hypothetical protein
MINLKIIDPNNLGDQVCSPFTYYASLRDRGSIVSLRDFTGAVRAGVQDAVVVFGGGGIFFEHLTHQISDFLNNPRPRKLIVWGAGINVHGNPPKPQPYPEFLNQFDLVGLREYGNPWHYVPCVSCQLPQLSYLLKKPQHDVVIYEHKDHPIVLSNDPGFPRLNNQKRAAEIGGVLSHLASGDTVITNTFHGVYWSLLMKRKVLLYEPFSSRFFRFQYQPPFVDRHNWLAMLPHARRAPSGYLDECRTLNDAFYQRVLDISNE